MKKLIIIALLLEAGFLYNLNAQVLNVGNNEQLYDQWCWAGCSKTILDYYGFPTEQCEVAEFVRTNATFHNFGSIDCCVNGSGGCNYWNYNYGASGSIQEILINFGGIQNSGINTSLSLAQITTEITNNRLFVIRWGWSAGGGHFIVGHGINGSNIYFMNPWYGEGLHIATYNSVKSGIDNTSTSIHTWTHTNVITSNMLGVNEIESKNTVLYPNPLASQATLATNVSLNNANVIIYNSIGQKVKEISNISEQEITINRDNLSDGLYYIVLLQGNDVIAKEKLIIAK